PFARHECFVRHESKPPAGVALMKNHLVPATLAALTLAALTAQARVKLVALPERARVVVSLSNPDATLVEEERIVTLQKGVNKVDFSWRGVSIDDTWVVAR